MNRNIIILFLLTCLFITACGNEDEPNAVSPINFEKRDYTVMFGKRTVIPFTGGSGGMNSLRAILKYLVDSELKWRILVTDFIYSLQRLESPI